MRNGSRALCTRGTNQMYGDALVGGWFWVVMGVSMDRTTAMLTDQIRKRVCLQIHGQFCLAL